MAHPKNSESAIFRDMATDSDFGMGPRKRYERCGRWVLKHCPIHNFNQTWRSPETFESREPLEMASSYSFKGIWERQKIIGDPQSTLDLKSSILQADFESSPSSPNSTPNASGRASVDLDAETPVAWKPLRNPQMRISSW